MITIFVRTLILYVLVVVMMRLMGKRQMGQLQPFEFVLTLMIAELAASPISSTDTPLLYGAIPILTLFLVQTALSLLSLKSIHFRRIVNGAPSIVVYNGKVIKKELSRMQCNLNDLLEQLRAQSIFDLSDVQYAIFEGDGSLSVLQKRPKQPLTPQDMDMAPQENGMHHAVILDGKINKDNLRFINKDQHWLLKKVRSLGYSDPKEILMLMVDDDENIVVQSKEEQALNRKVSGK
jgi:uncharacterized membrane protein YcaP (DUF421 family)